MYDDFFPLTSLSLTKNSPPLRELFRICTQLFTGTSRPKFIEWVKKFILEHLDNLPSKSLCVSLENFEDWEYSTNLDIGDET